MTKTSPSDPASTTLPLYGKRAAGQVAVIDAADLPLLQAHRWHLDASGYVRTYWRKAGVRSTTIHLHQLLRDAQGGGYRDHVSGDKLDNRRANLRPCTVTENNRNRRVHANSKTGLKGVSPFKDRYRAAIHVGRRQIHLGLYPHPQLAAIAYNAAALVLHGPFACLNEVDLQSLLPGVAHAAD